MAADKPAASMQVFLWLGPSVTKPDGRTYYQKFSLNGVQYAIGDFVFLYPESDEDYPHYVGKILSAFADHNSNLQDPHCIEIKWFERRTNLEPSTKGIEESEKEVFELDDTDINPIGCISGKCSIIRATHYEHAWHKMKSHEGTDWFFCRGYFRPPTNSFEAYSVEELDEPPPPQRGYHSGYSPSPGPAGHGYDADVDELPASKRKATGRACLQCGATSTPQWREGPEGPKTLCNACGVRYVRSLQKGGQRKSSASAAAAAPAPQRAPVQKNLPGSSTELTTPRAQHSSTVANPKQARPSARRTDGAQDGALRITVAAKAAPKPGSQGKRNKAGQARASAGDVPTPVYGTQPAGSAQLAEHDSVPSAPASAVV